MMLYNLCLTFGVIISTYSYTSFVKDERWFPPMALLGMFIGSTLFWAGLRGYIILTVESMGG